MSLLTYLDQTSVNEIIKLVGEQQAVFVGGVPSDQDFKLSVKTGIPFLSGNSEINLSKTTHPYLLRLFKTMNMQTHSFSQRISSESEMFEELIRLASEGHRAASFRLSIPLCQTGRIDVATLDILKNPQIKQMLSEARQSQSRNSISRIEKSCSSKSLVSNDIKIALKKTVLNSLFPADTKKYQRAKNFMDEFYQNRGIIEKLPGHNFTRIGLCGFIEPGGKHCFFTSFEEVSSPHGFVQAYISPQTIIPSEVCKNIYSKLSTSLAGTGAFGWVTYHLLLYDDLKNLTQVDLDNPVKNLSIVYSSLSSYFTPFDSVWDLIKHTQQAGGNSVNSAVYIPAMHFNDFKDIKSWEQLLTLFREQGLYYDSILNTGVILNGVDGLACNTISMLVFGTLLLRRQVKDPCHQHHSQNTAAA